MAKKIINTTLFDKVCTCGKNYLECNVPCNQCPEFLKHKRESQEKFEQRIQSLKK